MSQSHELFFNITPPYNVALADNAVQSVATGAAAGTAVFTSLANGAPKGKVFVCFEAVTTDCYVRFGPATSAATTASNGLIIKSGQPGRVFYMDTTKHAFVDAFASAAGTLKWQVCSPIGERQRQ